MNPSTKQPWDGTNRRTKPRVKETDSLEKLEGIVEHSAQFSSDEVQLVKDIIEAYRGWMILGKAIKVLIMILAGVSATVVAFGHMKQVLKSWLM